MRDTDVNATIQPPLKRQRLSDEPRSRGANPLGIRPLGNLLLPNAAPNSRLPGLGALARLPDDLVTEVFAHLEAKDWLRAQGTSRAFFAWCSIEGLWKVELLRATKGHLRAWHGTWRETYIIDVLRQLPACDDVRADTVASDVLYQPILCTTDTNPLFAQTRKQGTIKKVDASTFASSRILPREPLILTHAIDSWPALKRWSSFDVMANRVSPDALFRAEAAQVTLQTYASYARSSHDDSPLYLFHAAPLPHPLEDDFARPSVFDEDLFRVLGAERPDFSWLISGPARAGSTFHQDPNGTSAWNAVVCGAKAWVCFHPSVVPPGVRVSDDWGEVETPLSVTEWLLNYLPAARQKYGSAGRDPACRGKMLEGVCEAGETFFVPSGWWHLVINLEPSIAITQNFVGINELPAVLRFLRDRPDQISGLHGHDCDSTDAAAATLFTRFLAALDEDVRQAGLAGLEQLNKHTGGKKDSENAWQKATGGDNAFSFGFEADDLEDIEL